VDSDDEAGCPEDSKCSEISNKCDVPDIVFGWAPGVADVSRLSNVYRKILRERY
jgi:hypothetical protein